MGLHAGGVIQNECYLFGLQNQFWGLLDKKIYGLREKILFYFSVMHSTVGASTHGFARYIHTSYCHMCVQHMSYTHTHTDTVCVYDMGIFVQALQNKFVKLNPIKLSCQQKLTSHFAVCAASLMSTRSRNLLLCCWGSGLPSQTASNEFSLW